ncbi:MAG: ATP-binding cassette domain-containing protein [Vicinamibacterales bacterium]
MIEFDRVRLSRGGRDVLSEVTLEVGAGETLALVGRSGAGKSSLVRLVNRMLEPNAGRVCVEGVDTVQWDPIQLRRRAGYVPQDVGLFPHMRVGDNVAVVPRLAGWTEGRVAARTAELLALVGLPLDYASRWPHELSGGERQRVGVARALAGDPPIVLLDEAFSALDVVTRAELHAQFRAIQAQVRKTVVLVTHDMREAFSLAHRVAVLERGRLVACAAPDVLRHSDDATVQLLLEAAFG